MFKSQQDDEKEIKEGQEEKIEDDEETENEM